MLDKSHENRVRRHAERQGWRLVRNPSRTPTAPQFGQYRLARRDAGVMPEHHGYPYTLQQAQDALGRAPGATRRPYGIPPGAVAGSAVEPPLMPSAAQPVLSAVVGRNGDLMADVCRMWISPTDTVLDATYGKGLMWRGAGREPDIRHDLALDGVDLRALPEADSSVDVVVLDPPYRPHFGGTSTRMHDRYGLQHVESIEDVLSLYRQGIHEASRVLRPGGRLLTKCADMTLSNRLRLVHVDILSMLPGASLELSDMFVLVNRDRIPGRGLQRRARRAHSYLMVAVQS